MVVVGIEAVLAVFQQVPEFHRLVGLIRMHRTIREAAEPQPSRHRDNYR
jgi:hypothetical protein